MMIFVRTVWALTLCVVLSFYLGASSHAQQGDQNEIAAPITSLMTELDTIEKQLSELKNGDEALTKLHTTLEKIKNDANAYAKKIAPAMQDVKSQLGDLGAEPAKDAPPEPEGIAKERERLGTLFGAYEATTKKAQVVETRSDQLIRKIQDARRTLFADQILKRWRSPFHPGLWRQISFEAPYAILALKGVYEEWERRAQPLSRVFMVFIPCVIVWAILRWMVQKLAMRLTSWHGSGPVPFFRRAGSTVAISLARMVPAISAMLLFYLYLSLLGTLTEQAEQFALSIIFALSVFVMISALTRTILAPNRPEWRLFPMPQASADRLRWLLQGTAFVYAVDLLWIRANDVLYTPLSLTLAEGAIASSLFAFFLMGILLTPLREAPSNQEDLFDGTMAKASRLWPVWLKLPLWIAAYGILLAVILGYIPLANFIAGQILISGAILVMALLTYMTVREFSELLMVDEGLLDGKGRAGLRLSEPRRRQISALTQLFLNLILLLVVLPLILVQWGFSWAEIRGWASAAFFGFKFGPIELSLLSILTAIAIFVLGLAFTRMLQRWLASGLLRAPPMKSGIAHSIQMGIGYLGFIVSALLAASYTGLDFTNLAIVAGALSVGIGFGLQSIVNNFVSGLILLVERPIKVGDWVVVGNYQGHVRRISVRSTEIETFDRSSVIVPNSDLITSTVLNWTHGNSLGRITVAVGVSYDSDADHVYNLLHQVAQENESVLEEPKPVVVFEDFGASSLDFTLRVYIANIGETLRVQTELRMAILRVFRKENVEIPFPQQDVHIKESAAQTLLSIPSAVRQ